MTKKTPADLSFDELVAIAKAASLKADAAARRADILVAGVSRKTPMTISIAELEEIALKTSRAAGEQARKASIKVAGIDMAQKNDGATDEHGKRDK
jgi:hypothetical protein